jgi:class 3 adenylate cyclase
MNKLLSRQKLTSLKASQCAPDETADKLGDILKGLSDWELRHINPLTFANTYGFDRGELIDLFLYGSRIGLFDLSWNLVCPSCGGFLNKNNSVNDLGVEQHINHCAICNIDVPMNLDDFVEISFSINPAIKQIHIDPYSDFASYAKYFFSENVIRSKELSEYIRSTFVSFNVVVPSETKDIVLEDFNKDRLRAVTAVIHASLSFEIDNAKTDEDQVVNIDVTDQGFVLDRTKLKKGKIIFRVRNTLQDKTTFNLFATDFSELHRVMKEYPNTYAPFLTGKMLLNNQTFRNLFKIQNLVTGLKLNIRSLTVLFTDLKDSTALYDNIGDVTAYNLIQEHFKVLTESVNKYSGAIIKTMGDAIMATFSEPDDGMKAALDMMTSIRRLKETHGRELGLKVGIHEGPALAINNNGSLDYFGRNVNIAARIQGLAEAGEICFSDSLFEKASIKDILTDNNYRVETFIASLKGLEQETRVYKCVV